MPCTNGISPGLQRRQSLLEQEIERRKAQRGTRPPVARSVDTRRAVSFELRLLRPGKPGYGT